MSQTNNRSTGSLFVGQELPSKLQKMGPITKGALQVIVAGQPRDVTYIMGSTTKGWSVTAKDGGPFPTGEVQFELREVAA